MDIDTSDKESTPKACSLEISSVVSDDLPRISRRIGAVESWAFVCSLDAQITLMAR